jgi:hypothetical protein
MSYLRKPLLLEEKGTGVEVEINKWAAFVLVE